MSSDAPQPPPSREVPRVSFADSSDDSDDDPETAQSEAERAVQEENAGTSLDQPSQ